MSEFIPVRYPQGGGLEISGAVQTQRGLTTLENADLDLRGVIRRGTGTLAFTPTRSADPEDVIPASEQRAVWTRGDEIILETQNRIYALNRCAGKDGAPVVVGTATPVEIAAATDDIEIRARTVHEILIGLPGDPEAAAAQARVDRPNIQAPLVQTVPRATTTTITEPTPGRLSWTVTEGVTVNGPHELPSQAADSLMRHARMQVVGATQNVAVTYLDNGGLRFVLLVLGVNPASINIGFNVILDAIRGAPASAEYESRDGVIAGFVRSKPNPLRVWSVDQPLTNQETYAPTVAIPDDGPSGTYAFDLSAPGGFGADLAVTWTAPTTKTLAWALLDGSGASVLSEIEITSLAPNVDGVSIEYSPVGDPDRYVVGLKSSSQRPVCEVGPLDLVFRLVANTLATQLVYTRTSTEVLARWEAVGLIGVPPEITSDQAIGNVSNPTDAMFHRDADGVFLATIAVLGLQKVQTSRDLESPAAVTIQAGIQAVGIIGSNTRTVYSYRQSPTTWNIEVLTSTQDPTPTVSAFVIGADLEVGGPQGLGILAEAGVDDVTLRAYALLDAAGAVVFAATLDTSTDSVTEVEQHIVSALPLFLTSTPLGVSPRALLSIQTVNNIIIYEDSPTIFVQVSPPGTALVAGSWVDRGSWSRLRHRSHRARISLNAEIKQCDAVTVTSPQNIQCSIVISEQVGVGIVVDILSSYVEVSQTIVAAGNGINPRTAYFGQDKGALGYVDTTGGNAIELSTWIPGAPLSFVTTGTNANGPSGVWDITGALTGDGIPLLLLVGCSAAQNLQIELRSSFGSVVENRGLGVDIVDVVGYMRPAVGSSAHGSVAVALADGTVRVYDLSLFPAVNTIAENWNRTVTVGGVPVAVSTSVEADLLKHTIFVEIPAIFGLSRQVELWNVEQAIDALIPITAGGTSVPSIERAAIYSQQVLVLGQNVGAVEFLAFDLEETTRVGGVVLFVPRTGEVLGRSARGETSLMDSPNTRDNRYPHGSLVIDTDGGLTMGAELRDILQRNRKAVVSQLLRWPVAEDPHHPATASTIAYAAHGGYPRQYDGARAYETDWHVLPVFSLTTVPAAGNLTAGSYVVAATWTYENFDGQLEQSAPTFQNVTVSALDAINLDYFRLPLTERNRPTLAVWRSISNGSSARLFRDGQDFAQGGAGLISLGQSDEDLVKDNRTLDMVANGILPADPIDATDFMAAANGRIWTVDPQHPTFARFSLQQRPGFALHFSGAALLEHTRQEEVTSIHELSGRVILFTANGVAFVHGDGPDNTGGGSYTVPMVEPVTLGARSHSATTPTPDGVVYESGQGLRLLTRGLQAIDIATSVDAHSSRDGFLAQALAYTPLEQLVYIADRNEVGARGLLLFHAESNRWMSWTSPRPRDIAAVRTGETVILSADGRVQITDAAAFDRGGEVYVFRHETAWISVARSPAHQAANFMTVRGFGTYDGVHDLTVSVFADYVDTPVLVAVRPAATNANLNDIGRPYIWQLEIPGQLTYAIKIRVEDGAETNATFTLEGIDLRFDGTGARAFADLPDEMKMVAQ